MQTTYSLDLTVTDADILGEATYDAYGNNIYSKRGSWVLVDSDGDNILRNNDSFVASRVEDVRTYYVDIAGIEEDYSNLDSLEADSVYQAGGRSTVVRTDTQNYI